MVHRYKWLKLLIAGSPRASADSLARVYFKRNPVMMRRLAANDACPQPILERLAKDDDAEVRAAVAANPAASRKILLMLSKDCNPDVRYMLASASYVPEDVLLELTTDENPYVQWRVCRTLKNLHYQGNDYGGRRI